MKKLSTAKKIFLSLILVFSFVFVGSFAAISMKMASASTNYYGTNTISVTNGDFTSYSTNKNKLPYTISSGWNAVGAQSEVYAGAIDTSDSTFSDNDSFTLPANPKTYSSASSVDSKILMIKAKNNETGTKFGYESEGISLEANKFYVINIKVKTGLLDANNNLIANTDGFASIYTNLQEGTTFTHVNTSGYWNTYKIYVATDLLKTSTLNLQLRLGNKTENSTGVVFFDNIQVLEIANADYFEEEASASIYTQFINLYRTEETSFTNSNFENDLTGFNVVEGNGNVSVQLLSAISSLIEESNGANNFVYNNNKALFINNKTKTRTVLSSNNDNTIQIKQHGYYYLTMFVKTGNLSSGGLTITLDEKVASGEAITYSQTDITSADGSNEYNGFKLVSFCIRGSVKKDSSVGITFALGSTDSSISGWAIVDNISLYKINADEYSNKSSSNLLDLAKNVKEVSSVKNGSFDFVNSSNVNATYPMLPADWTYSNTNNLSGIIRVNSTYFASDCVNYGLAPEQNPGPNTSYSVYVENGYTPTAAETDQNVLMVRANNQDASYFTSSSISLTTNSSVDSQTINKIEVGIRTIASAKAFIKLVDSNNNELAVLDNISSTNWATYTIYVKNGISENNVKFVVGVKGNADNNYAFFDFAKFVETVDLSVQEILNTNNSCYVDLLEDGFYSHKSTTTDYDSNVYETTNWTNYLVDSTALSSLYNGIVSAPTIKRADATGNNLLVIGNATNSYQIINSNYNFSIKKGNYYEFSVYIRTELNADANSNEYGAYFELGTVNTDDNTISTSTTNTNKFVNIVTSSDDNNWKKYSIYVYAEKDETISVLLGLGTQEYNTVGKVYFDDLRVSPITAAEYNEQSANGNTIVSKVLATSNSSSESSNTNTNTNKATESNPMNIFVLFSSIILGIALVFAIAGYLIRRIPKRTAAKVEKSSYDVKPTKINEQDVKRQLKISRESKIAALEKNLNELKAQRDELKAEYEQKSNNEDNLTAKENIYKTYTKKINKLTKEIDYIESALTFNRDQANIRVMENMEVKKKQKESIQEFIKLKNKPEVEKQQEEKPKKTKGKKFNPNKVKKDN